MSFLNLPWGKMAVHDRLGSLPAIVFLQGTGCDASDFDAVLARLPNRRAVRLEFRGHGASDLSPDDFTLSDLAADVVSALSSLELSHFLLVGHSLGGMVGLEVVARCPDAAGFALLKGWTRLSVVKRAFTADHMYGSLDNETISDIRTRSEKTRSRYSKQRWDRFWRTVVDFDRSDILAHLTVTVAEVYGTAGANVDTQTQLAVPDRSNIDWHWIPGAGHYLPLESPKTVATLCEQTIDRFAR